MKGSLLPAMAHDLAFRTGLAALLGLVAAAGNLIGGYFVVRKEWPRQFLQYFLALGAGYMLAVAFVEIIPEAVHLGGEQALLFVLIGYFLVHLFEHTLAPHFHFGEETHIEEIGFDVARRGDVLRCVSAQTAGRIHSGVGGIGERAGEAQRHSGGGVIRGGDASGSAADERAAGAIEVRAAAFGRCYGIRCSDGFVARSEPRAELADGAVGLRWCG